MPDTNMQIRNYYEDIVERVTAEEILEAARPLGLSRRRMPPALIIAVAAAILVIVVIGPTALWFSSMRQTEPSGPEPLPISGDTVLLVPAAVVPDRPQIPATSFDPAQMEWERVDMSWLGDGHSFFRGIALGSRLVLLGSETCHDERHAAVWVSDDGYEWSQVHDDLAFQLTPPGSSPPCALGFRDVVLGGPGLVAVGTIAGPAPTYPFEAAVWTSVDGLTWTRSSPDGDNESVSENTRLSNVYRGGPGLVAIGTSCEPPPGQAGCDEKVAIWTSSDGLSWTRLEQTAGAFASILAEASESDPVRRLFLRSVAGNGSGFVGAIPTVDGFDFWTSQDGEEWTRRPSIDTAPQTCFQGLGAQVVAAETSFVVLRTCSETRPASMYMSTIWSSDDGQRWTTTTFEPGARILNVVAVGSTFVAVGRVTDDLNSWPDFEDNRPMIWTSTDGSTWVPVDLGTDGVGAGTLSQVVVGGPGLMVLGESADGPTLWVAVPGITP